MAKRPLQPKSILGTIEVFAVIGIFTLYALEFLGISTFSAIIPDQALAQFDLIGLDLAGIEISINQGVFNVMAFTGVLIFVYFVLVRPQIFKKVKKN